MNTNVIQFTFSIPLHSLHGYHKPLNINTSPCNVLVFRMSLMSLDCKSDISDMAFLLVIARGEVENQRVAILVQWVTWVFGRWKNRLHTKKICEGEFLFCEGAKVEKLEEEIWKHQQLLKILLQVLGWINISKNYHSKKNEFDTCLVWNSIRTDLRHSNRLKISIECRKW